MAKREEAVDGASLSLVSLPFKDALSLSLSLSLSLVTGCPRVSRVSNPSPAREREREREVSRRRRAGAREDRFDAGFGCALNASLFFLPRARRVIRFRRFALFLPCPGPCRATLVGREKKKERTSGCESGRSFLRGEEEEEEESCCRMKCEPERVQRKKREEKNSASTSTLTKPLDSLALSLNFSFFL